MKKIYFKRVAFRALGLWLILSTAAVGWAAEQTNFRRVTGPCDLRFPRDHGAHAGYRTEWWYYTGNLRAASGERLGFQFTIFRRQISPPGAEESWARPASAWRTQQIYLGHAAVADITGRRHFQAERLARGAVGLAGVAKEEKVIRIFLTNWSARIESDRHHLQATADDFYYDLDLKAVKPLVLHGEAGYSRKGQTPERASCYYSFTRLAAQGNMTVQGKHYTVEGLSWMDHEFSTAPLEPGLRGWDWFSLQFSDQTELMVFLLRPKEGGVSSVSSGTFVDRSGDSRHLSRDSFKVEILDTWKSSHSGATYPARWRLTVFPLALEVTVVPTLADQEMRARESTAFTYWEGSVTLSGEKAGQPLKGAGYVELTGYAQAFDVPL
ncbi:MAG: carotenoid 1,2-hydratase [Desulfobacterales bacterium]|nr:MAG: carotenoid 1,2-hydratase [Desulfobacterales bacterium]